MHLALQLIQLQFDDHQKWSQEGKKEEKQGKCTYNNFIYIEQLQRAS